LVLAPNSWAPTGQSYWIITAGVACELAALLTIQDSLGTRPYTPASGATLQAVFQRGDSIGGNTTTLTVTKTAAIDVNNRSLSKISISAADADKIISGTIVWTLTEGTAVNRWTQNWAVKKLNTTAGF